MGILDVKSWQDYIRMCTDGWEQAGTSVTAEI